MRCTLLGIVGLLAVGSALSAQDAPRWFHVEGRAVDGRGRPLDGVEVRVIRMTSIQVGDTLATTGADGMFAVDIERPAAEWEVALDMPAVLLSRRGKASIAFPVGRARNGTPDVGDVFLPPGVNLRGTVRGADGEPLGDATAVATDAAAMSQLTPLGSSLLWASGSGGLPWCAARSDADGRFELRGVLPLGTQVRVTKPGHSIATTDPIAFGDPVDVSLSPTGFARGAVVDAGGEPLEALVYLVDEAGNFSTTRSGPDGSFQLSLPGHTRYVIEAQRDVQMGPEPGATAAGWRDAPADDLRIVAIDAGPVSTTFPVRVVDAESGAPIAGARAAVAWQEFLASADQDLLSMLQWVQLGEPAADGIPRVRAPGDGEDRQGIIVATAPGHAPAHVTVAWKDDGLTPEVELAAAASIRGRVVDAATRAPLAGVAVHLLPEGAVLPPGQSVQLAFLGENAQCAARTGIDGTFEIGDLPAGRFALVAIAVDRPASEPTPAELTPGTRSDDVVVALPRGATVRGRVPPDVDPVGLWVLLMPATSEDTFYAYGDDPLDQAVRACRVDADGRYELRGAPKGSWKLAVLAPRGQIGGARFSVPAGELEVGDVDVERDVDVDGLSPARVAGTVRITGAEIPTGRLVVRAVAFRDDPMFAIVPRDFFGVGAQQRAYVDRSGTFELALPSGAWTLQLFDVVTGVPLGAEQSVEVRAGDRVRREFSATCGRVHVRLAPATEDDPFVGQHLEVALEAEDVDVHFPTGIALVDGRREHDVFLPIGTHELRLWATRAGQGNPLLDRLNNEGEPTRRTTVQPKAGQVVEVELRAPGT